MSRVSRVSRVSRQPKLRTVALALALAAVAGPASVAAANDQSSTAPAAPKEWSVGDRFRDCAACPQMVIVPAGSFVMGSVELGDRFRDCAACPQLVPVPASSLALGSVEREELYAAERPLHQVTIGSPLAVGVHEVTVAEFGRFVDATGHATGHSCWSRENHEPESRIGRGWRDPGFPQAASHPVVCVNWHDAQRYARWLSERTGERYRLPSESEWEYVARAGMPRVWRNETHQCAYANGSDASANQLVPWEAAQCDDSYARTAPVGSFPANAWGLHDVLGNAAEWTQDCWNESYAGAPIDGRAWERGECARRVLRGGAHSFVRTKLRFAHRDATNSGNRGDIYGFRVVRTLTP